MSLTQSEKYKLKFEKTYKVIIHNSIEKNKEILKDVNKEWSDCDLLIYSPSVESGVDYNVMNKFYKCYAVITQKSTSDRAFCQMLNRVRYYIDNNVLCLMPLNMEWKINEILWRFDEMKLNKWSNIEISNLSTILIHNDTETQNKDNFFLCSLLQRLVKKGHTFEYLDDKPNKDDIKKIETTQKEIMMNDIIKSPCITDDKFNELMESMKKNDEITRAEKVKTKIK